MVIRCLISAMDEIALTPSEARKEPEALFPCASSASSAHQYAANARWPVGGRSVAGRWPVGGRWPVVFAGGWWPVALARKNDCSDTAASRGKDLNSRCIFFFG